MATNKLFGSWTWTRKFPEPFNDPAIEKDSTDHVSSYNQVSAKNPPCTAQRSAVSWRIWNLRKRP